MKLISPYYPSRLALARAWAAALESLPGQEAKDVATLQTYLSRPGKYQAKPAPGTTTFRPDSGTGFSHARQEWVETPPAILELNKVLEQESK